MQDKFIPVPKTKLFDGRIVPAFRVSQYPCSQGDDGKIAIAADGSHWLVESHDEARKACEAAGFKLLTDIQFMAISANIGLQSINSIIKAGKRALLFERGWFQLSNGKRIVGFGPDSWVSPSEGTSVPFRAPDSPEQHAFFCTRG